VVVEEEKEEERLTLTILYQSLNLLLNDQIFGNKNPSLHFKQTLKQGKKFGVLRQSRNQQEALRTEQAQQGSRQKKTWMSKMKNCITKNRQVLKER
jgi:hypothetical protein